MERIKHDLRLSETVSPFGVGAIVDIRGESLIAPDTSWWDKQFAPEIHCERLVEPTGRRRSFVRPRRTPDAPARTPEALLYWRFPAWRFCERCTKLSSTTGRNKGKWKNSCECGGALVPMRYVAVCEKGSHIQDIPWFMWAHRGHDAGVTEAVRFCRAYKELKFVRSASHGEGLGSLRVACNGCGRSRPLTDLVMSGALKRDGIHCGGTQPWEDSRTDRHRASTSLWRCSVARPATTSPIASLRSTSPRRPPSRLRMVDQIRAHVYFEKVRADNGGPQAELVAGWIADELGVTVDEVLEAGIRRWRDSRLWNSLLWISRTASGRHSSRSSRLAGRDHSESDFVVDAWHVGARERCPSRSLTPLTAFGQVNRVREVRALTGFRRHVRRCSPDPRRPLGRRASAPDVSRDRALRGRHLHPVRRGAPQLAGSRNLRCRRGQTSCCSASGRRRGPIAWIVRNRGSSLFTRCPTCLIRRLAFASGYSSASLQERIYANSDRAGQDRGHPDLYRRGDAQGTLGGLVRLGHPGRLLPLLVAALDDADVCSNDPVCIESDRQGATNLNLSACHGCSLVSETSARQRTAP